MNNPKLAITFILLTSSLMTFAGQEGSGGNVCLLKRESFLCNSTRTSCLYFDEGFRVLEELQYPDLASEDQTFKRDLLTDFRASDVYPGERFVDLTVAPAGIRSYGKLTALENDFPKLSHALSDLFQLLKVTHIQQTRFETFYDAGLDVDSICLENNMQAAIKTTPDGKVVLSIPAWEALSNESQEVLLIHETLRFAQLFTPWFKDVSNQELQKLTMLIYSKKSGKLKGNGLVELIEKKI